jgi:DNA-binding transcriptional ArsR family regulator
MVHAKTSLFEARLTEASSIFKALAHPARLRILEFLAETKACITGDISEDLPLSRTTVNQHLRELKEAGLIQGHIEGTKTRYCLNPDKINEMRTSFEQIIQKIEIKNYKCK